MTLPEMIEVDFGGDEFVVATAEPLDPQTDGVGVTVYLNSRLAESAGRADGHPIRTVAGSNRFAPRPGG